MPYKDPEIRREYMKWYSRTVLGKKPRGPKLTEEQKKEKARANARRWRELNPDKINDWRNNHKEEVKLYNRQYINNWRDKLRREVIDKYGGKCACCNEKEFYFLDIEHTNGGGTKQRKSFKTYTSYLRWLLVESRDNIRILCHNCNKSRRHGDCPHNNGLVKGETGPFVFIRDLPENARKRAAIKFRHNTRRKVVKLYGNKCACCQETIYEFLAIDHIDGQGTKHIRSFKSYTEYLVWLLREKRNGFRILCHNCNRAIWRCGSCPHGNGI